jgi:ATP-dependent RNA helicase SUPV3L1/SUV3
MTNRARIKAVLGPTNTGKTHLAIERMLGHGSGMMGLPLRLLAREVYDRVVAAKGEAAAALITGEEKIAPESARYFVCTVEAMPLDRVVEFLAIDEIQVARDLDRGHVFTDRILNARGYAETMLLGSDTMRPMIRKLTPDAEIIRRERMSTLRYSGRRVLGGGSLRHRRIAPPSSRWRSGGNGRALAPHAQRASKALSGRRGGLPRRDRCDRHGP